MFWTAYMSRHIHVCTYSSNHSRYTPQINPGIHLVPLIQNNMKIFAAVFFGIFLKSPSVYPLTALLSWAVRRTNCGQQMCSIQRTKHEVLSELCLAGCSEHTCYVGVALKIDFTVQSQPCVVWTALGYLYST